MKLSITDQFLCDFYNLLEKTGDVAYFILKRRRTLYDVLPGPKNPIYEKYRKAKGRARFNRLVYYLKTKGFIEIKSLQSKKGVILTKKGINKAVKASFKVGNSQREKRKDGKWIMIAFDMPKKYSKSRNLLRSILENLGYKMFQYSVWVTPYDVYEKTEEALQFYRLDRYVRIFLIEELD